MSEWPQFSRGGYLLAEDGTFLDKQDLDDGAVPRARLMRVTGILDWSIKGDGFGAMAYYGGGLMLNYVLEDLQEELRDGVFETWKLSEWDPNKKLKRDAYRGTQAHMLYQELCQGETVLDSYAPQFGGYFVQGKDGLKVLALEYDAGVCEVYHDIFQHFPPGETLSEVKVYWTEHGLARRVASAGYGGLMMEAASIEVETGCEIQLGVGLWSERDTKGVEARELLEADGFDAALARVKQEGPDAGIVVGMRCR